MIPSVLPTYSRAPLHFVKGEGSWLIEEDGRRFLDLGSGIAVASLGHSNPVVVNALVDQANRLWHVSNLYEIPQQQALADKLVDSTFADTVFFTNSGTEATELAVKMVRKYWYEKGQPERVEIISFTGAFHGRSSAAIAAAPTEKMVKGFGPLLPGFLNLKWGDMEALKAAVTDKTAAILIEPIQGEGGINVMPDDQLKALRKLCDETGVLLVFDEIQCGMGRSGRLFAHEWAGVTPDVMLVAKGIGGGFPLGACLATEKAARGMGFGSHGSTYGGNPLGMAAGMAVMEAVANDEFLAEVAEKGERLRTRLEQFIGNYPELFELVRGEGLMLGIKMKVESRPFFQHLRDKHQLLTVAAGDNTLRVLPPLVIGDAEIDEFFDKLSAGAADYTVPDAS